jgi:bla regulator protein blaR1
MPNDFFDNAYFLQSIGWAIANSFWQAGFLWLVYLAVTFFDKKLSALVKYNLSLALLFLSFTWFVFTLVQNYQLLNLADSSFTRNWLVKFQLLNKALPYIAVFYFTILALYIIKFFHHYFKLRFISTSNLLKVPVAIKVFTTQTAIHLGIKKKVKVWLSAHVEVPSVTGFIKPIILLPAAVIANLSIAQVNAILLHELAHIKRNDYLLNFLQSILVMILYFNPFVVLLSEAVKKERENCCDDWVLNYKFNQVEYAKALLVLEEQRYQQIQLALAATNNKKVLLHRIKRLLNDQPHKTNINFKQKFKLIGFCFLIFMAVCIQIPSLINKNSLKNKRGTDIIKKLSITNQTVFANVANSQENSPKIISDQGYSKPESKKTIVHKIHLAKKQPKTNADKEYILAMINEDELLNKNMPATIATSISNKEKDSLLSKLVKIEEEQSGKKQINTYYFQLKDDKGKTDITPLLIMKKYKLSPQKNKLHKLRANKLYTGKKRIST